MKNNLIIKALEFMKNEKGHDRDAEEYDKKHVEIYNPTEQNRIRSVLGEAVSGIETGTALPHILDFGAGTGNLTRHLLDLRATVVSADVSFRYLEQLSRKLRMPNRLHIILLNGDDLSNIADNTFDMVATYSVLHHVQDYLSILDEFARVTKPGGIIYIDHEVCPSYWEENKNYETYLEELGSPFLQNHLKELGICYDSQKTDAKKVFNGSIKAFFAALNLGQRRSRNKGGDIHVLKHDHIEWDDVTSRLSTHCEIVKKSDYLVCRENDESPRIWGKWRDRCFDMRYLIAQKRYK